MSVDMYVNGCDWDVTIQSLLEENGSSVLIDSPNEPLAWLFSILLLHPSS